MKRKRRGICDKVNSFTVKISQSPPSTPMCEYLMEYLIVFLSSFSTLSVVEYVLKLGIGTYYESIVTIPLFIFTVLLNLLFGGISIFVFHKCTRKVRLIYGLSPLALIVLCAYWVLQTVQVLSECVAVSTHQWFSVDLPVLGIFNRISVFDLRTAVPILFLVGAFALSVLFSVLIVRVRRIWIFVLLLFPCFWLAANYDAQPNDFIVNTVFLVLIAAIPFSVARVRKSKRRMNLNARLRPAGMSFAFFSVCLAAMITFSITVPRNQYVREDFFSSGFSNPIEAFFQMFTQSNTGMSGGKLGDVGHITQSEQVHLEVSGLKSGDTVYLKGYTGSVYTGHSFELLPEKKYTQNLSGYSKGFRDAKNALWKERKSTAIDVFSHFWEVDLPVLMGGLQDTNHRSVTVKRVGADSRYTYVPYYAYAFEDGKAFSDGQVYYDVGLVPDRKGEWTFSMYSYPDDQFGNVIRRIEPEDEERLAQMRLNFREFMSKEYLSYLTFYKSFADQMYTELPEDGRFEWMEDLFWENMSLSDIVQIVRETVQNETAYSLSPGVTPTDRDFVNYFLQTNKKGFCTHYAASAVMLFRAAGVPARYAEGYVVTETDIKDAENDVAFIKGRNAHAWAEIYVEPIGWIPVEVTPGFSASGVASESPEENEESVSDVPQESDLLPSSEPESSKPKPEPNVIESAEEASDAFLSGFDESSGTVLPEGAGSSATSLWMAVGLFILTAAGIIGAVLSARGINIRRRKKQIHSSDRSFAACSIYTECLQLMRLTGLSKEPLEDADQFASRVDAVIFAGMSFKDATQIAERARFSNLPISEEERTQMLVFLKMLQQYVNVHLPFYKKLSYQMRYPLS